VGVINDQDIGDFLAVLREALGERV